MVWKGWAVRKQWKRDLGGFCLGGLVSIIRYL